MSQNPCTCQLPLLRYAGKYGIVIMRVDVFAYQDVWYIQTGCDYSKEKVWSMRIRFRRERQQWLYEYGNWSWSVDSTRLAVWLGFERKTLSDGDTRLRFESRNATWSGNWLSSGVGADVVPDMVRGKGGFAKAVTKREQVGFEVGYDTDIGSSCDFESSSGGCSSGGCSSGDDRKGGYSFLSLSAVNPCRSWQPQEIV